MRKLSWNVTFEVVTPESAEHGDAAERGYLAQGVSLRDAVEEWGPIGPVEADCYPVTAEHAPRWLTANEESIGTDGECESRGLHIPEWVRPYSRVRLARLLGCYGVK